MERKIAMLALSVSMLQSGCALGMLKTVTGMAEKGKPAYPAARAALDKNPTIAATATSKIELRHHEKKGKEAGQSRSEYIRPGEAENLATKAGKDLATQLAKSYPLKNVKYQPDLKVLLSGSSLLKAMTVGGEIERVLPDTVTEDYVFLTAFIGDYTFAKNGKRNIQGELLGDLYYSGSFSAELIDSKTRKVVVIVNLGKASQTWKDVTESTYDQMVSQRSVGSYGPEKAYAEMIASSKNAMNTFVNEVKAAQPPQAQ